MRSHTAGVDEDFLALPRHRLADAALSAAMAGGASYADLRLHAITTEIVHLRDGELESAVLDRDIGLAVRVLVDGTWGFASHAGLTPDIAAESARHAVGVAVTLAALNAERIELADEPVYRDATWVSDYRIDPFTIPTGEKIAVLEDYSGRLLAGGRTAVASITSGRRSTRSRSRRSTPTPSAPRSPSSGSGPCRRSRR